MDHLREIQVSSDLHELRREMQSEAVCSSPPPECRAQLELYGPRITRYDMVARCFPAETENAQINLAIEHFRLIYKLLSSDIHNPFIKAKDHRPH